MKVRDEAYQYYFYFMKERMSIFWKRYEGQSSPFTEDVILAKHKFTNVYRAQDRVSQYLIREVIYRENDYNELDHLLRILVFKVFNNIDTWIFLEDNLGKLTTQNFNVSKISTLLTERIKVKAIFSPAYMMTGSHEKYKAYISKAEKWLRMIEQEMIKQRKFEEILKAKSLEEVYNILLLSSFIGPFLAYQYAIDFNYSPVVNFDENSFVKAGIGAIRGVKKCFILSKNNSIEDCIRFTQENLSTYQSRYGHTGFLPLFDRMPTLIDLQNCFCETDKYLRVKLPHLDLGNVRIKQKFIGPKASFDYFFPPKWNINQFIKPCTTNTKELTLF
jgi:hypothetical protein